MPLGEHCFFVSIVYKIRLKMLRFYCLHCLSLKINELIHFNKIKLIINGKYFFYSNKRIIFALFLK